MEAFSKFSLEYDPLDASLVFQTPSKLPYSSALLSSLIRKKIVA